MRRRRILNRSGVTTRGRNRLIFIWLNLTRISVSMKYSKKTNHGWRGRVRVGTWSSDTRDVPGMTSGALLIILWLYWANLNWNKVHIEAYFYFNKMCYNQTTFYQILNIKNSPTNYILLIIFYPSSVLILAVYSNIRNKFVKLCQGEEIKKSFWTWIHLQTKFEQKYKFKNFVRGITLAKRIFSKLIRLSRL